MTVPKDPSYSRNYRPGQHGPNSRGKKSDYGLHLDEKQRVKCHYGRITEKQFKKQVGPSEEKAFQRVKNMYEN